MTPVLLTICIATYNRAAFLPATLASIVPQLAGVPDVDVLIVDGNSTDETETVVRDIQHGCAQVKYVKLPVKGGVDKDYDIAVRSAEGSYCWLFTDDDLMKPGAIVKVRDILSSGRDDMLIVNAEVCDFAVKRVLKLQSVPLAADVCSALSPGEREAFFRLCAEYLTFIGGVVLRNALWTERSREEFYGSRFIHVGVISTLGDATRVRVIAEPQIQIRLGNAEWNNIAFKVWTQLWPKLIWSFANLSDECKRAICAPEPWKNLRTLVWYRALGTYARQQYAEYISSRPRSLEKAAAWVIVLIPQFALRALFKVYAQLRNNKLQSYCLADGSRSQNSWSSKD